MYPHLLSKMDFDNSSSSSSLLSGTFYDFDNLLNVDMSSNVSEFTNKSIDHCTGLLDSSKEESRLENKRGRPKAAVIGSLIREGSNSVSDIKCKFCSRVFPREKSLQAHLRTHTGMSDL